MKTIIKTILILLILSPAYAQSEQTTDNLNPPMRHENIPAQHQKNETTPQKELSAPYTVIESKRVEQESTAATNKNENKKECEFINRLVSDPMYLLTFFLAVATFGLWRSTHLLVTGAENTAKRQLRAYVFVSLADGEKLFLDENECLSAPLIVKNYGQTPAYNLKCSVFIGPYKLPLNETLDPPQYANGSIGCLAQNQVFRQYPTLLRKFTQTETDGIVSGEYGIYVWGYLEYTDIFKSTQKVQFRMASSGGDFARGELAYCNEGNEAT